MRELSSCCWSRMGIHHACEQCDVGERLQEAFKIVRPGGVGAFGWRVQPGDARVRGNATASRTRLSGLHAQPACTSPVNQYLEISRQHPYFWQPSQLPRAYSHPSPIHPSPPAAREPTCRHSAAPMRAAANDDAARVMHASFLPAFAACASLLPV